MITIHQIQKGQEKRTQKKKSKIIEGHFFVCMKHQKVHDLLSHWQPLLSLLYQKEMSVSRFHLSISRLAKWLPYYTNIETHLWAEMKIKIKMKTMNLLYYCHMLNFFNLSSNLIIIKCFEFSSPIMALIFNLFFTRQLPSI